MGGLGGGVGLGGLGIGGLAVLIGVYVGWVRDGRERRAAWGRGGGRGHGGGRRERLS